MSEFSLIAVTITSRSMVDLNSDFIAEVCVPWIISDDALNILPNDTVVLIIIVIVIYDWIQAMADFFMTAWHSLLTIVTLVLKAHGRIRLVLGHRLAILEYHIAR